MTTNKPEVVAWYFPSSKTTLPVVSLSARNGNGQSLIRLSDYEALQADYEKLRKHLQNLIDQTTPLVPEPGNPMWSRRIQLDEVMAERDQLRAECEKLRKDAERWEDVSDYVGVYQISSHGRVRSLDRIDSDGNARKGKILNPSATPKGYLKVSLWAGGSREERYVHRMVAEAFIDNHARLPQVNHLDGDPGNNHLSNLEWVTSAENLTHARRVLGKGVRPVYGIHKEDGSRIAFPSLQHAVEAGFTRANIQKCIAGVRTHHKGYHWFDAAMETTQ